VLLLEKLLVKYTSELDDGNSELDIYGIINVFRILNSGVKQLFII